MKEQMELFDVGGLADEGGTVDPVSGNDVPVGSTQEEVRDDIPAQLSEGEFVLPADVVRYHGLEKIMALRDEAKQGLQKMEDMGQMGNSEEAILDDDVPFSIDDLDMEDVQEYNVGGVVQPQGFTGIQQTTPSAFANYQPQYVQYQAPSLQQSQQQLAPSYVPVQQQVVPTMQQQQLPEFEDFISTPMGGYDELREFRNPTTGEVRQIPFVGGKPIYPIPEGFTFVDPEKVTTEEVETTPTTTGTARVVEDKDDVDTSAVGGATTAFGGNLTRRGNVENAFKANVSFDGGLATPGQMAMFAAGRALGKPLPEDMTATLTNIQVPRPEGVYTEEPTSYSVNLKMSGKTYNDLFTDKNVTERGEMEDLMKDIVTRYGEEYLTKTNATLDLDELLEAKRERDAEAERQEKAKLKEARQVREAQKIADEKARQAELNRIAQAREDRILYGTGDDSDDNRDSGTTASGADLGGQTGLGSGATPGGFGGTGRGRSDIGMAKGGMAKQMEKSGLTPKK